MADSNAENTGFGALSQAVKHHKIVNEGVESMVRLSKITLIAVNLRVSLKI